MPIGRSLGKSAGILFSATLALASTLVAYGASGAESIVNFWLSNRDEGPDAPVIYVPPGGVGEIELWVRPAEGYRLSAFSLNLVAEQPGVLSFDGIVVHNPLLQQTPELYRHQLVFDSTVGLEVEPSEIRGFLGLTFFADADELPNGGGIGPDCGSDPFCSMASGTPSWHVATVTFQVGMSPGSTELFLEIGKQGLWQTLASAMEPDAPTDTSAIFGLENDALHEWDTLDETDHRCLHLGAADAVIQVATADFDQDGDVDGADFLIWQTGLGAGTTLAEGDADGDDDVDDVDLTVWKSQFGSTNSAVAVETSVPEPSGMTFLVAIVAASSIIRFRRNLDPLTGNAE